MKQISNANVESIKQQLIKNIDLVYDEFLKITPYEREIKSKDKIKDIISKNEIKSTESCINATPKNLKITNMYKAFMPKCPYFIPIEVKCVSIKKDKRSFPYCTHNAICVQKDTNENLYIDISKDLFVSYMSTRGGKNSCWLK